MKMKKTYMVPETAFEQFLKPMGILMESLGGGAYDPEDNSKAHAPKRRKPF